MTDVEHHTLANNATHGHGIVWRTVSDAAGLAALVIVTEDVNQRKVVLQSDTGQLWYPTTTGVAASFNPLLDGGDPNIAWVAARMYGDGSDGDLVMAASGNTAYSAEKNYHNFSWPSSSTATLQFPVTAVAAFALFISGALDLSNCPAGGIQCNGGNGGASGGTAGGAASATRTLADGTMLGAATAGIIGGASTTTTGTAGTIGGALPFGLGGSGGSSGAGGTGSSGAGGAAKAGGAVTLPRVPRFAPPPDQLVGGVSSGTGSFRQLQGGCSGGSGSGGGGDGTASGGGGGAGSGAPVIAIYCKKLILGGSTPASAIQCKGGTGGAGAGPGAGNRGGGSGGAGGGGGCIIICCDSVVGTAANFCDVSGGDAGASQNGTGTGTGADGSGGGDGGRILIYVKGVLFASLKGAAGTAGGAHSGVTAGTTGTGAVTRLGL